MSLVIFVLYIAWFFLFLQPVISSGPDDLSSLIYVVEDEINDEFFWQVNETPIHVDSDVFFDNFVLMFENERFSANNSGFSDESFLFDGNYFFVSKDLPCDDFYLYSSNGFYDDKNPSNLYFDDESVSTSVMSASFYNSVISELSFSSIQLENFYVTLNNAPVSSSGTHKLYSKNTSLILNTNMSSIVHKHYFFSDFPGVYSLFLPQSDDVYSGEISFDIKNPESYNEMSFNANESGCKSFSIDSFDIDKGGKRMTFIASKDFDVDFCVEDDNYLDVDVDFEFSDDFFYKIIFSSEAFSSNSDIDAKIGFTESFEGVSYDLIQEINAKSYSSLKKDIGLPDENNFKIKVFDSDEIYLNKYSSIPVFSNVYSKEYAVPMIDKYSYSNVVKINIGVWR